MVVCGDSWGSQLQQAANTWETRYSIAAAHKQPIGAIRRQVSWASWGRKKLVVYLLELTRCDCLINFSMAILRHAALEACLVMPSDLSQAPSVTGQLSLSPSQSAHLPQSAHTTQQQQLSSPVQYLNQPWCLQEWAICCPQHPNASSPVCIKSNGSLHTVNVAKLCPGLQNRMQVVVVQQKAARPPLCVWTPQ